ncbi:MAG TPA: sulfite exporter TauE/SafE family protein [Spirochaetia bacterium]|nr:sulfite exporter TauE/SafE family protein [Spirochaetia bacterium]
MTTIVFVLLIFAVSVAAGLLGVLTGLGGGVVLIPALVLLFHVDIHFAMGASLIAVITNSSAAAPTFMAKGLSNLRIGLFLETAAAVGAIVGAILVAFVPTSYIGTLLGVVLLYSAYLSSRQRDDLPSDKPSDPLAVRLQMEGEYPGVDGIREYRVYNVLTGTGLLGVAGLLSGLLGIGSGAVKVLAMDRIMRLPYKISTTTSNFIIGITAAASAGVYFSRGYIDPGLTMPVMLGVLAGSTFGARVLIRARSRVLRIIFVIVIAALGIQMVLKSLFGLF